MIFVERKGFCGEKEFIFHHEKSPQKICDVLQNDAMARWRGGLMVLPTYLPITRITLSK